MVEDNMETQPTECNADQRHTAAVYSHPSVIATLSFAPSIVGPKILAFLAVISFTVFIPLPGDLHVLGELLLALLPGLALWLLL
jgi:hypothetical protein